MVCSAFLMRPCIIQASPQETDLGATFGSPEMMSLAAGHRQSLTAAPATVTVVTREDIDRLNPRSLADILNHVAGFHIAPAPDGRGTVDVERGRVRNVLFMVDNVPYVNGLIFTWQDMNDALPYDIERVEVLRGPASAVYGADAAGGVVNIVTRSGSSAISGAEVGGRVGSFASRDLWLQSGTTWRGVGLSAYAAVRSSDETNAIITRDAQSSYDTMFGTHASLAPGRLAGHRDVTELQGNLIAGPWKISAAQFAETDFHTGAGISESLDPSGIYDNRLSTLNALYRAPLGQNIELRGFLTYARATQGAHVTFYPPGSFGAAFPEGVLDGLRDHENREHAEISLLRSALGRHDLLFGVGGLYDEYSLDDDERNFIIRNGRILPTGRFAPGAGVGDPLAIGRTTLQAWYLYFQDEWRLAPDWCLTSGVRWDDYRSFGGTVNPRLALVWLAGEKLSFKVLYTSAFTPPNVTQTRSNGIFFGLGNPSLNPERSRAIDLGATLEWPQRGRADLTVYRYRDSSLIQLLPSPLSVNGLEYFNQGQAEGWGIESAFKYQTHAHGMSLSGSYAYHQTVGHAQDANQEIALAARHQFTTEASIPLATGWTLNANTLTLTGRVRPAGDPRPAPSNYTLVGCDVGWRTPWNELTFRAGAKNLLNTNAREPNSTPQGIYYDLPLPGRELFLEVSLRP